MLESDFLQSGYIKSDLFVKGKYIVDFFLDYCFPRVFKIIKHSHSYINYLKVSTIENCFLSYPTIELFVFN